MSCFVGRQERGEEGHCQWIFVLIATLQYYSETQNLENSWTKRREVFRASTQEVAWDQAPQWA